PSAPPAARSVLRAAVGAGTGRTTPGRPGTAANRRAMRRGRRDRGRSGWARPVEYGPVPELEPNIAPRAEHHHRDIRGGSARAAVFGVSDGLVSNVSLIL